MANVKQTYTLEVIAKGLKEVTSEIRGLRADMARVPGATDKAEKGYRKVTKSVGEYDRNAKGAANATNNSTKAFSKMAQGMSGTLVPAYATVAANVFALTAAFGALERAMDTQILINASEELATQTGRSLTMLADSMKDITGNAISMKEALQSASIAASAGFDNTTIERLTQVARNASVALGRDMTDSLNRVFKGAIKAEPELLDELGIILRLDPATREYAASL
jgi:methyl-accepting chemotaxis protein